MIGNLLAHYRVTAKLGAGGMGEVYRADDTRLGREVALKILPEAFTADRERLARFEREARVLASLNHPNIAAIYSFESAAVDDSTGTDAGRFGGGEMVHFLVMELAEGQDLAERITRGPIAIEDVIPIALQVAEALEAAHERDIIHRDLKPANVKLAENGKIKVLDFGLAKALDPMAMSGVSQDPSQSPLSLSPTLTQQMTGAGVILGTAAYMSPEQAKGRPVDKRADIWAFGAIVWEMISGRRLFTGDSVTDTLADVLRAEIDLEPLAQRAPGPLVEVLRRCLERDPNRRLHDIADARLVLEDLEEGQWEVAAPVAPRQRGFPLGLAVGAVAGLILGGALMWALRPTPPAAVSTPWKFEIPIPDAVDSRPAVSPDQNRIAYTSQGQLWVREFDRLESRRVTGGEGATSPFWSPDGRSLGFSADGALWRLPVEGGARSLLSDRDTGSAGAAVWLPDDRILFDTGNSGVLEVSALGGETRTVIAPAEGQVDFHLLEALPDGKGLLTIVHKSENQAFDNVTLLDGDQHRELVRFPGDFVSGLTYSDTGHILFGVEGGYGRSGLWAVGFSIDGLDTIGEPFLVARKANTPDARGETLVYPPHHSVFVGELVWVDRSGRVLETIGEPHQGLSPWVEVSPDGRQAAASIFGTDGRSLWVIDLESGSANRVGFEQNAALGAGTWHPSGERLAYAAASGGDDLRLMIKHPDGSPQAERLTEGHLDLDFSPDGRYLVFVRPRPGFMNDLWLKDLESGEESVFVQTDTWDIMPAFSPDGAWVAMRSQDEIFIVRFDDPDSRWQVSDRGGASPRWGRDGQHLYYLQGDDLMEVGIDVGPPFRSSPPQRLFTFRQAPSDFDYMKKFDVDGDGERFLMVRVAGIPPGIVVQRNWLAGLQR